MTLNNDEEKKCINRINGKRKNLRSKSQEETLSDDPRLLHLSGHGLLDELRQPGPAARVLVVPVGHHVRFPSFHEAVSMTVTMTMTMTMSVALPHTAGLAAGAHQRSQRVLQRRSRSVLLAAVYLEPATRSG